MKKLSLFLVFCLLFASNVFALDTLDVPLTDGVAFLKEFVDADGFAHAYRLKRGGVYIMTGIIQNEVPLVIVGEKEPVETRPAMIITATDETGANSQYLMNALADFYIRDVYIKGIDDLGNDMGFLRATADSITVTFENCYITHAREFRGAVFNQAQHTSFIFKNCFAFNFSNLTGPWGRLFFSRPGFFMKELVMENCTQWNTEGELWAFKESLHRLVINHCTFVANGGACSPIYKHPNFVNTNNIFYDVQARGDCLKRVRGMFRGETTGDYINELAIFMIDTIPLPEAQLDSLLQLCGVPYQTVTISNNCVSWSERIWNYIDAQEDTITLLPLAINPVTLAMCNDDEKYPGLHYDAETIYEVDPGFTNNSTDYDNLIKWLDSELYGTEVVRWDVDLDGDRLTPDWPMVGNVVDFTYSNVTLATASTEGLHLGDLHHWYPEEKALMTSVSAKKVSAPNDFALDYNYPNPFNPLTTINYSLKKAGEVKLTVYNVLGKAVKTLVNERKAAGQYNVKWNATNDFGNTVAAGIYFYKLQMDGQSQVHKMTLLK